jgi:flagellar basal-body rod modification protein FlgD
VNILEVGAIAGYATAAAAASTQPQQSLGTDAFLRLLVTQLANQDPLNPMDDRDLITQLAQLSTLEQMTNMNAEIKVLRLIQATGLVGRTVDALRFDGTRVIGEVTEVAFAEDEPLLVVGDSLISLDNLLRVLATQPEAE